MLLAAYAVPSEAGLSGIFPASPPHAILFGQNNAKGAVSLHLLPSKIFPLSTMRGGYVKGVKVGYQKRGLLGFKNPVLNDCAVQLEF